MLCTPIGVHANETDGTRASNPAARLLPIEHTIMVVLMKMRRRPLFYYVWMGRGHQVLEGGRPTEMKSKCRQWEKAGKVNHHLPRGMDSHVAI